MDGLIPGAYDMIPWLEMEDNASASPFTTVPSQSSAELEHSWFLVDRNDEYPYSIRSASTPCEAGGRMGALPAVNGVEPKESNICKIERVLPHHPEYFDHEFLERLDAYAKRQERLFSNANKVLSRTLATRVTKLRKFRAILDQYTVDLIEMRKLSWNGIPDKVRPVVWQLLIGYLPCNIEKRKNFLCRKRNEYLVAANEAFAKGEDCLNKALWHQIHIDVLRTNGQIPLYQHPSTQMTLKRILYVWAVRNPDCGYVQGINDLATPFFQVFLSSYIDGDPNTFNPEELSSEILDTIEADCFWCLSRILDGIYDHFICGQPGIQRQISKLKELVNRIDVALSKHFAKNDLEYIQFAFRWMNCFLMREFSLAHIIRMWDTYLSEGKDGFTEFHIYVCAAFLLKWASKLKYMEFQDMMIFLQTLPTNKWSENDVEVLLSEAFTIKSLYEHSPKHLCHYSGSSYN